MDKLKPILAHKFWIVFGVALLVPLIGWWMDTGFLKAEITKRKGEVDNAFKNSQVSGEIPNEKWKAELDRINKVQDAQKRESAMRLYQSQKALTVWPEDVRPMMKDLAFRAEIPQKALDIYRNTYFSEVERVRQVVKPYQPNGQGLVVLPESAIPYIPRSKWEFLPPTPEEMWNAREDLDLIEALLKAVVQVNGEATAINEAAVRQIDAIELTGGTRKVEASGGGGGGGGATPAAGGPAGGPADAGPVGGLGGSAARGGGTATTSATFPLSEEFGSDTAGGGGGAADPAAAGAAAGAGGDASGGGQKAKSRYVDEDPNLPYRRRGFGMKVIMNHQKVPDLIAALASLPWPVEVVRVQQVAKFDDAGSGNNALGGGNPAAKAAPGAGGFGGPAAPMADGFGARPARPMALGAGAVGGEGEANPANEAAKRVYDAAMNDPMLAEVMIAGLMTLYLPPKEGPAPADGQQPAPADGAATPAADAPGAVPPADGSAPPAATPGTSADNPAGAAPAAGTPAVEKPAAPTNPEGTPKPSEPSKPEGEPKPPAEPKPEPGK